MDIKAESEMKNWCLLSIYLQRSLRKPRCAVLVSLYVGSRSQCRPFCHSFLQQEACRAWILVEKVFATVQRSGLCTDLSIGDMALVATAACGSLLDRWFSLNFATRTDISSSAGLVSYLARLLGTLFGSFQTIFV